jgi:beta-galactosidase GanA
VCTPSYTPPRWLALRYPGALRVNQAWQTRVWSLEYASFAEVSEALERMLPWVRAGGTLVVGPVSAIRDRHGSAPADAGFGLLEAHLGATCLWTAGMSAEGDLAGRPVQLSGFCAALQAGTAEVHGRYTTGYGSGQAWLTRQRVGAGSIVMIAAPGKDLYCPVIEMLLEPLGVRRFTRTAGAVVLARSGQGQRGWVLVELHGTGAEVELPDAGTDLLTGEVLPAGPRHLGPFEVRVVRC